MLKLSEHAKQKHKNERWNAVTILEAYRTGDMQGCQSLTGKTADVICGFVNGECVGMIVSKSGVIITGYAASLEYWKSV
jgi:hypothetical protein